MQKQTRGSLRRRTACADDGRRSARTQRPRISARAAAWTTRQAMGNLFTSPFHGGTCVAVLCSDATLRPPIDSEVSASRDVDRRALCQACGLCCDGTLFGRARLAPSEVRSAMRRRLRYVLPPRTIASGTFGCVPYTKVLTTFPWLSSSAATRSWVSGDAPTRTPSRFVRRVLEACGLPQMRLRSRPTGEPRAAPSRARLQAHGGEAASRVPASKSRSAALLT